MLNICWLQAPQFQFYDWVKQSYMSYYDGRRKQHFRCRRWCSRVFVRTNAQKIFHDIYLGPSIKYARILLWIFQSFPHPPWALGWTCRSIPAFLVCDLFDLITLLPFWLCSFAIVSSYCFTSEIQKFITHLNPITWTKTTPQKKRFFWSNPYKIEVMITSLLEILELPNFGHMTRFTI